VKRNEIASQRLASLLIQACRQRLGGPVTCDESLPNRLAARLVVDRLAFLEPELEGGTEQLLDALAVSPGER
jgi:hypothetical protein